GDYLLRALSRRKGIPRGLPRRPGTAAAVGPYLLSRATLHPAGTAKGKARYRAARARDPRAHSRNPGACRPMPASLGRSERAIGSGVRSVAPIPALRTRDDCGAGALAGAFADTGIPAPLRMGAIGRSTAGRAPAPKPDLSALGGLCLSHGSHRT